MSTAPSPAFGASTHNVTGLVVSKYCGQASLLTLFFQLLTYLSIEENTSSGVSRDWEYLSIEKNILHQEFPEIGS